MTIHIQDGGGAPIAGATVTGSWSTGGSGTCITDAGGSCSIQQGGVKTASTTFTVTDVQAGAAPYDAGANSDPDGDSDGTAITVAAPA